MFRFTLLLLKPVILLILLLLLLELTQSPPPVLPLLQPITLSEVTEAIEVGLGCLLLFRLW